MWNVATDLANKTCSWVNSKPLIRFILLVIYWLFYRLGGFYTQPKTNYKLQFLCGSNIYLKKSPATWQRNSGKAYLSPSQVRKGVADLFDTMDKIPYLPTKSKKGKGRAKGTKLLKRLRHKTVKKGKKTPKKE